MLLPVDEVGILIAPTTTIQRGAMQTKLKIGVLISGGGSNLQAILDACEDGRLQAEVLFVGTDNPEAQGLKRAARHRIPSFVVDYARILRRAKAQPDWDSCPQHVDADALVSRVMATRPNQDPEKLRSMIRTRIPAEIELLEKLSGYPFDLLVLAGFMRTLTPYFIDRLNRSSKVPRIMNIHPSLLPAFPGVDGYGDTFRHGCKVGGCTVHFVDDGEDTGPIIGQASFPIAETDDLDAVRKKGLSLEWRLYPRCIQYAAEGRLRTPERTHHLKHGRTVKRKIVEILPRAHP